MKEQRDLAHRVATIEARDDFSATPDRELPLGDDQELVRRISDLPQRLALSISTRQAQSRQSGELLFAEGGEERDLPKYGDDVARVISHV